MNSRLSILLICAFLRQAHAQGTVEFTNLKPGLVDAPVYEWDGVTKVSGSPFIAELLAGPNQTDISSIATTPFLSGNLAGYFSAGVVGINTVGYGHLAWVQVDVWSTSSGGSFAQAQASGLPNSWWQSSLFTVQTGSPFGTPTPPGVLTGLGTSPVYLNPVPEPSALQLAGVAVAILLSRVLRSRFR